VTAGQIWVEDRKRAIVRQRVASCRDKWAGEAVVPLSLGGFKGGNNLSVAWGQISLLRSLLAIFFMLS